MRVEGRSSSSRLEKKLVFLYKEKAVRRTPGGPFETMTTDTIDRPGFFPRIWNHRYAILHHLLLALTIASATVFFEQIPQFAPIDLATRGLMSIFRPRKSIPSGGKS